MKLGACYYPEHWPRKLWASDARRMAEAGLSLVRIGEFAWSRIEPEPGRLSWDWLDEAVETLRAAGLSIIIGTPTATPPKWLVDRMPDMLPVDRAGRVRQFGSRRHYCFSHEGYRREAARITEAMARRYGEHPAVVGWQCDNEYGCHDTVRSYSPAARAAFRRWLRERYGSVRALNQAWGNVFWSMEYRDFDEIELPNLTVTEANPAHWLAFHRFSSDQVIAFHKAQAAIIRAHSPGRFIAHNAMGFFADYDHHELGKHCDLIGWDSYPLGFLEQFGFSEDDKRKFARQGHPDIAAFHHDLYRGCAKGGRWGVLEQQPGPVNWARHNPAPLDGMVALWTVEAMAHGAELVNYFRWRQAPFAQEQMHAGLLRPDDKDAPALGEVREAGRAIQRLGAIGAPVKQAALIFSYEAQWITQIQPQGAGLSALWAAFECYRAARRLGLNVDILPPEADLSGHALVVIPCLPHVPQALVQSLGRFDGQILIGPRSGSRTDEFQIPETLAPGPLQEILPIKVVRSESLREGVVHRGEGWEIARWLDHVDGAMERELVARDGAVACWKLGKRRYLAAWPQGALIDEVMRRAACEAGLDPLDLPEGLRRRRSARHDFLFNYSAQACDLPEGLSASGARLEGARYCVLERG